MEFYISLALGFPTFWQRLRLLNLDLDDPVDLAEPDPGHQLVGRGLSHGGAKVEVPVKRFCSAAFCVDSKSLSDPRRYLSVLGPGPESHLQTQ